MNSLKAGLNTLLTYSFTINLNSVKDLLRFYFALITIHVLFVYYLKNLMGVSINNPIYVGIKMWKEVVIGILILINAIHYFLNNKRLKINFLDLIILVFTFLGVIYTILGPNRITAIWSFRSIFEIFAFYLLGRMFFLNKEQINSFLYTLVIMGCLTSIFGIVQVQFLGPDFFQEVYGVDKLSSSFRGFGYDNLRASSTFITPHEFGLYLVLCFVFSSYLYKSGVIKKPLFTLFTLLLIVGLAFSLSRSSILILIICYGLYWVRDTKTILLFVIVSMIGALIFILIGAIENFLSVLDGTDPSSMGRFVVFNEFLEHLKENPFGSGLGTVGVVVRRFMPDAPQFEGEIFNIFAMMSVIGGLIYLSILGFALLKIWLRSLANTPNSNLYQMVAIVVIALTLRELILPRDFTNYVIGWFLIGSIFSTFDQVFNEEIPIFKVFQK